MELQKGRPENTDNRLDKEIRVYDFLDKLGIQYQRIDHEAAMTMEACEEIDRTLGDDTAICPWRQHHDLQKSVPVQSSGDGFLSSSDAW